MNYEVTKAEIKSIVDNLVGEKVLTKNAQVGCEILYAIVDGAAADEFHHGFISWPNILYYPIERAEEIVGLTDVTKNAIVRRIRSTLKCAWDHTGMLAYYYPIRPDPQVFVYGLLTLFMEQADFINESPVDTRIRKSIFECIRPSEVRNEREFTTALTLVDYMQTVYFEKDPMSLNKFLQAGCSNIYPARISKFLAKINWAERLGFKVSDNIRFDTRPQKFVDAWLALLHAAD